MILFLDFDGVLHPEYDNRAVPEEVAFCCLPRFEAVVRDFPAVQVVITSLWRYQFSIEKLKAHFSADIQARIIGATPLVNYNDTSYYPAQRETEIVRWLAENDRQGAQWIAIDDAVWQFKDYRDRLVRCDRFRGFDEQAAADLMKRLSLMISE